MGDLWMSTVDHAEPQDKQDLQLYPLDTLRPAQTGPLCVRPRSHVVRRSLRRPSLLRRFLALLPLTAAIVMVGLAWLAGAQ